MKPEIKYIFRQNGFSMIEMLVAILVLSLGLLGVAGLQAATAKYRINTQANSAASQLFSEFTERVRVNPGAAGSSFDPTSAASASQYALKSTWDTQLADALTVAKNCETTVCTSEERAIFDMTTWRLHVKNVLPQGAAYVEGDRRSGIDVTLLWMDKEQTDKSINTDTGGIDRSLKKSAVCSVDADGTIVHNCCPAGAAAPAGVRCLRMSFLP